MHSLTTMHAEAGTTCFSPHVTSRTLDHVDPVESHHVLELSGRRASEQHSRAQLCSDSSSAGECGASPTRDWEEGCVGEDRGHRREGGAQRARGEHVPLERLWLRHETQHSAKRAADVHAHGVDCRTKQEKGSDEFSMLSNSKSVTSSCARFRFRKTVISKAAWIGAVCSGLNRL